MHSSLEGILESFTLCSLLTMVGESSSKKKKKLQTKSPQSPVTSSDVVEETTPAANPDSPKKVGMRLGSLAKTVTK